MRILVAHNFYQKAGGEDVVFHSETALLEAHGHEVTRFTASNDDVARLGMPALAVKTIWNRGSLDEVRGLLRRTRAEVIHVHNTVPLISPSIYYAARAERIPVVQTLHNYRLICPKAELRRDGRVCEECVTTKTRWPGVFHGCYRDSRLASGALAAMLTTHAMLGTWRHRIDRYIAMSEFMRRKYIEGGFPGDRITVKPNFLGHEPTPGPRNGGYVLFVGRLSEEKGIQTLVRAVGQMATPPLVKIAGQGPLMPSDRVLHPSVEWLGHQSRDRVIALMQGAALLVFPSEWYEGCPLTIIEAFATGLPVIASRLGNMAEMVTDGKTGLLFTPGDASALAAALTWGMAHPAEMAAMGSQARREFEEKYTPERNYQALMDVYHAVLEANAVAS